MSVIARRLPWAVVAALAAVTFTAVPAAAQPFGTFTWQLQPFCNRVTVSITQDGAAYTLDGFDDQCGDPKRAPAVGTAVVNPDGSVGVGLAIVTSGGRSVHVDGQVSPSNGSGTWRDSEGNSGALALGANTGGSARRAPTGAPVAGSFIDVSGSSLTVPYGMGVLITGATPPTGAAIIGQWGDAPPLVPSDAAALKGISRDGIGVSGTSTSSLGVYGLSESRPGVGGQSLSGPGVAGASGSGPGVWAESLAPSGTALELSNGALKVSGPTRTAFQHTATAGNTSGHITTIDHPLANGDPNAMLFITHAYVPGAMIYDTNVSSVYYNGSRWTIYHDNFTALPLGARYNVLVIKQ